MKRIIFLFILIINFRYINSQSILNSEKNTYYNLLFLSGELDRTTLNYKTISELEFDIDEQKYIWNNITFDKRKYINDEMYYKFFSPELYLSLNTATPYGINDEALWQGKGINSEINLGFKFSYYGMNITFYPELTFSQNLDFEYIKPNYNGEEYDNKANIYGYYGLKSIDAPQRFGNKSFFTFNFGQSEIRYSHNNFTIGFGTQSIWLGPAKINPIIHSNNSPSYPKIDFGIRKTKLSINNIFLGEIEFRYWLGYLHESKYFDNNSSNDENLITGIAIAYEFPFFDGLSLGFNRTMTSKWENITPYSLFTLMIPFMEESAGYDKNDQRASIVANYFIPNGGINFYLEWARNDYNTGIDNLIRYPFHTQAFTLGFDKSLKISKIFLGELIFELSYLESSMDYHFFYDWGGSGNSFYTHHIITQGYTNYGQYLGAGIGSGGNSQYIEFKLYYPIGHTSFFIQRANPDMNYSYFQDNEEGKTNTQKKYSIRAFVDFGLSSFFYLNSNFHTKFSIVFRDEHNPLNENRKLDSIHRYNTHISFWIKYVI